MQEMRKDSARHGILSSNGAETISSLCLIPNLGKHHSNQLSVVTQNGTSVLMQTIGECRKVSYLHKVCSCKTSAACFKGNFGLFSDNMVAPNKCRDPVTKTSNC
uniref:Uncharacterized protein n=1 Tax=Glossina austeni TaxID=7395 RepID=A0A1A9ULF7_GLOAU